MRHTALFAFAALTATVIATPTHAQMSASDVVVRMDQLENQVRDLTGQVEQLQYRNQQLEQQLRRMQEDTEFRFQELGGKGGARAPQQPMQASQPPAQRAPVALPPAPPPAAAPVVNEPSPVRPLPGNRRSDVFDPNADPNAPGVPRPLGALPAGQPSAPVAPESTTEGRREPGAPLDITAMAGNSANVPPASPAAAAPAPAAYPPAGPAVAAVAPPTQTPRDQYDLAIGYIQRKDYALAEETLRDFVHRYPNDRLAGDANYWLGESLFMRQRYRDAADIFLNVSTKYETAAKAPESLLRLGQSLAAIGEKETACATLGEVGRKYPRAPLNVRQGVEREQKRVHC